MMTGFIERAAAKNSSFRKSSTASAVNKTHN
jgi:hypothetical protein